MVYILIIQDLRTLFHYLTLRILQYLLSDEFMCLEVTIIYDEKHIIFGDLKTRQLDIINININLF